MSNTRLILFLAIFIPGVCVLTSILVWSVILCGRRNRLPRPLAPAPLPAPAPIPEPRPRASYVPLVAREPAPTPFPGGNRVVSNSLLTAKLPYRHGRYSSTFSLHRQQRAGRRP
ncbi:hypothetical protein K504DRAFT_466769 [Pleomassaria siparia CBS 279.74]|uniref:Uncharacterized protein n=1 Tax=Pleomassaria siparia CBS 279.74 TaxID=1314801 RepID=A0A6G1KD31_9PLEO|nr:hypothetical protein K504DRAFT_466769 [Pleomassaria siparia CBS 279.74]